MKKTILYLFIFIAVQIAVTFAVVFGARIIFNETDPHSPKVIMVTSGVASVITIAIFYFTKWCSMTRDFIRTRPWMFLFWTVVLAFGIIIPLGRLEEFIPSSWTFDTTGGMLAKVLTSPEGYFIICMLAPLAEEVVFRGAIISAIRDWLIGRSTRTADGSIQLSDRSMERRVSWIAILVSAVLFAGVHFNPAQMPHAIIMGIILGWLYVKSGSIVPGFFVHWINNSTAYVFVNLYPNIPMDAHLSAYFGNNERNVWLAVGYSLLIALPALYQLIKTPQAHR